MTGSVRALPPPRRFPAAAAVALAALALAAGPAAAPLPAAPEPLAGYRSPAPAGGADRQHIVYFRGTEQELEIYKIFGRREGPTVMILGGIQGDEPGGFLSADLYVDTALERGNLIVVPRANFKSIISFDRGTLGDMNRKFSEGVPGPAPDPDPDQEAVRVIKNLMAEADVFLNLHDGSGFYRHSWESDMANPRRYGQCIIADAEEYADPRTGRVLRLGRDARRAVEMVNREIPEDIYKFRFSNHDTLSADTRHAEQRGSATFYALTALGIPAYGIETSKQLPSLEMKIRQHNLAVNAFMEIYGVVPESPRVRLEPPELSFIVVSVEGHPAMAVRDGETLLVPGGALVEILHVASNYSRGLSADVLGLGGLNDIGTPLAVNAPTAVVARRDNIRIGRVGLGILPGDAQSPPRVVAAPGAAGTAGAVAAAGWLPGRPSPGTPSVPAAGAAGTAAGTAGAGSAAAGLPAGAAGPAAGPGIGGAVTGDGGAGVSGAGAAPPYARPQVSGPLPPPGGEGAAGSGGVTAFILEVDGRPVSLAPGGILSVRQGARIRMVDISSLSPLPASVVMNFRGFVGRAGDATGNDRGTECDTARDLIARFATRGQNGFPVYQLGAEDGKEILARAFVEVVSLQLESIVFEREGKQKILRLGERWHVPAGARVILKEVRLLGGLPLEEPRLTLGGRPLPVGLPQTLLMPQIAVSLAVFSKGDLAGKVVLYP
ncbi:MAG: hypothetical protein LBG06_08045 [Deltaproteobacteria bacterium]|jgi:hypothetical protein|nr:hypothetical protein [Deltaproteobacteria bacterium]